MYSIRKALADRIFPRYDVNFVGVVLPGDRLEVKLKHVVMNNGKKAILEETVNQRGEKVLMELRKSLMPPQSMCSLDKDPKSRE